MGQEYRIDRQSGLVFSAAYGDLTLLDFMAHHRRLLNDPDFDPEFHHLADLTRVGECTLTPDDIRLFDEEKVFSAGSRRALLVDQTEAMMLSTAFQTYREANRGSAPIEVFDDYDKAVAWLLADDAVTIRSD